MHIFTQSSINFGFSDATGQPLDAAATWAMGSGTHKRWDQRAGFSLWLLCTDARGRTGLPEESVLDLHTADLCAPLQRIARVTLEHCGVSSFPTVATPAPVLWDPRVVAGRGCRH